MVHTTTCSRTSRRLCLMTALSALLLLVLAPSVSAVIDGQPDGNQHPNVGLIIGVDSQGRGVYSCTGTLVDPTTVLTAAHCVGGLSFGTPIARILVDFDDHLRQDDSGTYIIDRFVEGTGDFDPLFRDGTPRGTKAFLDNSAHDIGLLHLKKKASTVFPGITPMPITGAGTNEQYRTGTTKNLVLQVGYGTQRIGAPGQPGSYFIDYTRNNARIQPKKLTDALLFLGSNPNDSLGFGSPCSGDSGSPIIRAGTIISTFTFSQSNCQNTGGGPRLDAGPARDFLRSRGLVP